MSLLGDLKASCSGTKKQKEILMDMEKHDTAGTPCIIAGAWGTGKTLLLAYKAIKMSCENKM